VAEWPCFAKASAAIGAADGCTGDVYEYYGEVPCTKGGCEGRCVLNYGLDPMGEGRGDGEGLEVNDINVG
jgi:hypothetical protein